jgi:FtsH-binding integral membrane protein
VASQSESPGCRSAAIANALLIGTATVFMVIGLSLVNDSGCTSGSCETLALTLLYGGLPISALFGVALGDLVLAWPLDITFWVVIGVGLARFTANRDRNVLGATLVAILLALAYGLVLSLFVEIAI